MSKGIVVGDKIKVTEGALVGSESLIKKINRHKMEAMIQVKLMGDYRDVVVGLEVIEKLQ
jgi:transcriptional antiterminator NusG